MAVGDLITREGVTLSVATDTAGVAGAYSAFGRVSGSINVSDGRNSVPVSDFDTLFDAIVDQVRDGRTVSLSWTSNLVLDDAGYTLAKAAYENDDDCWVKLVTTDRDEANTETEEFLGGFTQFDRTFNESGVAQGSFTFTVSSVTVAS
jgi:hypothetical protein